MKYKPRKKVYENYNNNNYFNPETMEAYSYKWWLYFDKLEDKDVYVFNDYNYSNTTSKHQWELRIILRNDFPEIYKKTTFIRVSRMQDAYDGICKHILTLANEIQELKDKIAAPKTRKKKNEGRREEIAEKIKEGLDLLKFVGENEKCRQEFCSVAGKLSSQLY